MSIAAVARVNRPPGPDPAAASRTAAQGRPARERIVADQQGREVLDGLTQRPGQAGAEEGEADALDPGIRAQRKVTVGRVVPGGSKELASGSSTGTFTRRASTWIDLHRGSPPVRFSAVL